MRTVLTVLLVFTAVTGLSAQTVDEIVGRSDRRTAREHASRLYHSRENDSLAITLYLQWLAAVPNDVAAVRELVTVYDRNGRTREADTLRTLVKKLEPRVDPRVLTLHTLQVNMGTYKVLMPSKMRPAQTFPAVVILHGNGHTAETMMGWARTLQLDSAILIFPQAPYPKLDEIMASHTPKYSASGLGIGFPDSLQSAIVDASSAWYHDAFLDAASRLPISTDKPILVGFSQGGFHALTVATRYPFAFRSVVTICASMYDYGKVRDYLGDLRTNGVDVLVTHGKSDQTVPLQTGELIDAWLTSARVEHVYMPFDGGHWPSGQITDAIRDWIRLRLP